MNILGTPESQYSVGKITLNSAQITTLQTAWCLFKENIAAHARNIFAKFYEQNPEYLSLFEALGNDAMHQHTEHVLESIGDLIETGLNDAEKFNSSLYKIMIAHPEVSKDDVKKLNKIIRQEFLRHVEKHKTKTLEVAIDLLLTHIESNFKNLENMKTNNEI